MATDPRLTDVERRVLDTMRKAGRQDQRTFQALQASTGLEADELRRTLQDLASRKRPLVHSREDTALEAEVWFSTPAALDAEP